MIYDADYFIAKFEAIPDELWTTGAFTYGKKHCVLGHCGGQPDGKNSLRPEVMALHRLLAPCGVSFFINDGGVTGYCQDTPKARILAALRDVKAKEGK